MAASIHIREIREGLLQDLTIEYLENKQTEEAIQILKYCPVPFQITTLNKLGKAFLEKGDKERGEALIKIAHELIDTKIIATHQQKFLRELIKNR